MASSFHKVSGMNEAFGNPKGNSVNFSKERLSKQLLSVADELGETFVALGADKKRVEALVVVFKAGLAALDFPNTMDIDKVRDGLIDQHVFLYGAHHLMGIDADADMDSVIQGLYTRFIKDPQDEVATIKKHAAKGVTDVYLEGDYPRRVLKSGSDQPDAPTGKFLKSASFSEPKFHPVPEHVSVVRANGGAVFCGGGESWMGDMRAKPSILPQSSFDHAAEQNVLSARPDYGTADAPKMAPAAAATLEEIAHPDAGKTYTFEQFVEYGRYHGANIVNGMPWSFQFHGFPVSHENDEHYLIGLPHAPHTLHFFKGQEVMIAANGFPRVYTPSRALRTQGKVVGEMNDEARKLLDRHNAAIESK